MSEVQYGLIAEKRQVPLTGVEVRADIAGRGASVRIIQSFTNPESHPVEAVYRFPLPESSSVCSFRAHIDGRVIESEIEERDKAFEIYDDAMMKGHGAYLLDQERPNIFTLSVGNLNPGKSAVIEISYVTLLDCSDSEVRFHLPTTISPRYLPAATPDRDGIPEKDRIHPTYSAEVPYGLRIRVDVQGREAIEGVSSPTHTVRWHMDGDAIRVEFSADEAAMDRDFVLTVTGKEASLSQGFGCNRKDGSFFHVDFSPRSEDLGQEGAPRPADLDLVFVLDCSGSMGGSSIAQAKKALEILLRGLEKGMSFNIYTFGSTFKRMSETSLVYSETTLQRALAYLGRTNANMGGTEILAPLADIYNHPASEGRKRSIVLITDGQVGNERAVMNLVMKHAGSTSLFTVGIGHGPNDHFIKGMARAAGGAAELIAPGERIEPKVLGLFGKVLGQRIEGLSLASGPDCEQAPSSAVAFTGEVTSLFARVKGSDPLPREILLKGVVDGKEREWIVPLRSLPEEGSPIPFLWAREAIREMEEGVPSPRGSRQTERKGKVSKESIVSLAKEYGVISSETSFVAVETRSDGQRTTEPAVLRKVPVMLTEGWHGLERLKDLHAHVTQSSARFAASSQGLSFQMAEPLSPLDRTVCDTSEASHYGPTMTRETSQSTFQDVLFKILSLQRGEGGFVLDREACKLLGVDFQEIKQSSKQMKVAKEVDRFLVLSTAIVLEILDIHFASQSSAWKNVVGKTKSWLEGILQSSSPRMKEQHLMEWAREYARNRIRIS